MRIPADAIISPEKITQARSEPPMKRPSLFDRVALARDVDQHGLKRGDVATLVDTVPHPAGGPEGLVLEVTNALGESLRVVIVTSEDVEPLRADEVFAVREFSRTT